MLGTKSCICACFPVLRLISLTHVIEGYRIDTRLVSPELRLELPYSNLLLERVETLVGTFTPETWTLVPELWYSVYITIPRYTPYLAHTRTHLPSHTPTHTPIYLHTPLHTHSSTITHPYTHPHLPSHTPTHNIFLIHPLSRGEGGGGGNTEGLEGDFQFVEMSTKNSHI